MHRPHNNFVKKAQKESLFYQELSKLFMSVAVDDEKLHGLSLTRVKLSDDGGICLAFFYCEGGLAEFEEKRKWLVLYKPSLRKALARQIPGRYTPDLVFKFDDQFEKVQRIESLLDTIKEK